MRSDPWILLDPTFHHEAALRSDPKEPARDDHERRRKRRAEVDDGLRSLVEPVVSDPAGMPSADDTYDPVLPSGDAIGIVILHEDTDEGVDDRLRDSP